MSQQEVEHVYLIGPVESSVAKIGRSTEVKTRLRTIQNSSPAKLDLLWSTPGGETLEKALHQRFRDIRLHGEWFDFGDQDRVRCVKDAVAELPDLRTLVEDAKPAPVRGDPIVERNVRRARLMPAYGPTTIFEEDPKRRVVKGWAKLNLDVDYYVSSKEGRESPESDLRCWCGHQMGSHSNVRPHACGGSIWYGVWSDCLCLGYEGPLPQALADYDLPGNNWSLWKAS